MAEMTIRLRIDPQTGKRDIIVSLGADADALPHEHEQRHRALVDRLIQGGIVAASELGKIIVEREQTGPASGEVATEPGEPERVSRRQGQ